MRLLLTSLVAAIVAVGCGGGDARSTSTAASTAPAVADGTGSSSAETVDSPAATGKAITTGRSQYGTILFDTRRQAIYIFENDAKGRSNCYGQCAKDWPPVYTKGVPQARGGVKRYLLGTTKRRDGRLQVTYRGRPLYYYANEGPGEVKCHNVFLNGGLWWVLGANGKRKS